MINYSINTTTQLDDVWCIASVFPFASFSLLDTTSNNSDNDSKLCDSPFDILNRSPNTSFILFPNCVGVLTSNKDDIPRTNKLKPETVNNVAIPNAFEANPTPLITLILVNSLGSGLACLYAALQPNPKNVAVVTVHAKKELINVD